MHARRDACIAASLFKGEDSLYSFDIIIKQWGKQLKANLLTLILAIKVNILVYIINKTLKITFTHFLVTQGTAQKIK